MHLSVHVYNKKGNAAHLQQIKLMDLEQIVQRGRLGFFGERLESKSFYYRETGGDSYYRGD